MARTTASDVNTIFDTDLSTSALDAWIDIANELVDDIADKDSSIDSTRLTKIEKLAAAHLAASQDQRISNASSDTRSVNYQGNTGMNFHGTKHGQAAIGLDPTGTLAAAGKVSAIVDTPDAKDISDDY